MLNAGTIVLNTKKVQLTPKQDSKQFGQKVYCHVMYQEIEKGMQLRETLLRWKQ